MRACCSHATLLFLLDRAALQCNLGRILTNSADRSFERLRPLPDPEILHPRPFPDTISSGLMETVTFLCKKRRFLQIARKTVLHCKKAVTARVSLVFLLCVPTQLPFGSEPINRARQTDHIRGVQAGNSLRGRLAHGAVQRKGSDNQSKRKGNQQGSGRGSSDQDQIPIWVSADQEDQLRL